MKMTGSIASRVWNENQPISYETAYLNRLGNQISNGGSPAEPLILHNIKDLGGLNNVKVFWLG